MNQAILVTGGAGYIGSACVKALVESGYQVVIFDNFSTGQIEKVPAGAEVVNGDVTNYEAVLAVGRSQSFSAVVHFAAKKAVGESEANPSLYFKTNVIGSFNILSMMEECQIPHLIFSSTAAVYNPGSDGHPLLEDDELRPVNVYGRSKLIVEEMIKDYARLGKISNYHIFRYFNVAGDVGLNFVERKAQNVFPLLARTAALGEEFSIFGNDYNTADGTCVRDYIHLADLVSAHLLALNNDKSGIYNLGTGKGYSVSELVTAFAESVGHRLEVKQSSRRPGDPASLTADASLARRDLGWHPKHSLAEMVESTIAAYQNKLTS